MNLVLPDPGLGSRLEVVEDAHSGGFRARACRGGDCNGAVHAVLLSDMDGLHGDVQYTVVALLHCTCDERLQRPGNR